MRSADKDLHAAVRREVIAALVEIAKRHATGLAELYEKAVEHGREEIAQRAYANQDAWTEVAAVLRWGEV